MPTLFKRLCKLYWLISVLKSQCVEVFVFSISETERVVSGHQSSMFVTWTTLADAGLGSVTYWKFGDIDNKHVVSANKSALVHTDDFVVNRTNFVYRAEMVGLDPSSTYREYRHYS